MEQVLILAFFYLEKFRACNAVLPLQLFVSVEPSPLKTLRRNLVAISSDTVVQRGSRLKLCYIFFGERHYWRFCLSTNLLIWTYQRMLRTSNEKAHEWSWISVNIFFQYLYCWIVTLTRSFGFLTKSINWNHFEVEVEDRPV